MPASKEGRPAKEPCKHRVKGLGKEAMGLRATGMETRTVAQARGDGGVSRGSCAGFGDFCGKSTTLVPLCAPACPCG